MNLTEQNFEDVLRAMSLANFGEPEHFLVPPQVGRRLARILFYKPPIRKASGLRKRKLALYWRRK